MSVGVDGASETQVAQRHNLEKKGLWPPDDGALFIPVDVAPDPRDPAIPDLARNLSDST